MRRIGELVGIRAGEGRLVGLLGGLFATVETARGLAEIAADALFVSRAGIDGLPYLYVVLGLVSLVACLGYGAALGSLPRRVVMPALPAAFAALAVGGRVGLLTGAPGVLPAVWLTAQLMAILLLTFMWTVASTTLNARQAKRLFPICTSAAIAGAFGGTLVAGPLARLVGVENLLVVAAGLLIVGTALTAELTVRHGRRADRGASTSVLRELGVGFGEVRRTPLMRLVVVAYVLLPILLFSVSLPFLGAMRTAFPAEVDLAAALGLLTAAVTAVAFVVAVGLAGRIYARFGVATAAMSLPIVYVVGFAVWIVQFGPATAAAVRFSQQVTQRGLSNAAWSALFNVVPNERRPQVMAFVDGVPGQVGTLLAGGLLIAAGTLLGPSQVFAVGLAAALACLLVVIGIRRRYGEALVASLRNGLAEQVLARPDDTASALAALLGDGVAQPQDVALHALAGHDGTGQAAVREWVVGQLDRGRTLRAQTAVVRGAVGRGAVAGGAGWGSAAASGGDPGLDFLAFVVERRARRLEDRLLAALQVLGVDGANGPIRRCLRSSDPDVRGQAIEALDAIPDRRLGRALTGLIEAGDDGRATDLPATLRTLAADGDPWIRALAERTLNGETRMTDPDGTLAHLEPMILLRRVPLFAALEPEDLQRVAAVAVERVYRPGEALVREGDAGDELIVIVDGRVRVVVGRGETARIIRRYGPGDHIGELAVLTDRPRSATVIAEAGGARGLVIGGAGLRAILTERPDAAMAMLATLAARIAEHGAGAES